MTDSKPTPNDPNFETPPSTHGGAVAPLVAILYEKVCGIVSDDVFPARIGEAFAEFRDAMAPPRWMLQRDPHLSALRFARLRDATAAVIGYFDQCPVDFEGPWSRVATMRELHGALVELVGDLEYRPADSTLWPGWYAYHPAVHRRYRYQTTVAAPDDNGVTGSVRAVQLCYPCQIMGLSASCPGCGNPTRRIYQDPGGVPEGLDRAAGVPTTAENLLELWWPTRLERHGWHCPCGEAMDFYDERCSRCGTVPRLEFAADPALHWPELQSGGAPWERGVLHAKGWEGNEGLLLVRAAETAEECVVRRGLSVDEPWREVRVRHPVPRVSTALRLDDFLEDLEENLADGPPAHWYGDWEDQTIEPREGAGAALDVALDAWAATYLTLKVWELHPEDIL